MKAKIFLILFSSVVTFLTVESLLRFFWLNPYANSSGDTVLKLRLPHKNINNQFDRSAIDKEHPSVLYRTNSRNYIEPVLQFDNPDLTIAFLGGSTTECSAVSEKKRFPFLVTKLLEKKGIKVNSLNAGRSGSTIHDSINILLNHVSLDNPDVVVFKSNNGSWSVPPLCPLCLGCRSLSNRTPGRRWRRCTALAVRLNRETSRPGRVPKTCSS